MPGRVVTAHARRTPGAVWFGAIALAVVRLPAAAAAEPAVAAELASSPNAAAAANAARVILG